MLPRLLRKPVLLRLGIVLITALAVTVLAYCWGPPLPYHAGEVQPRDLRVRVSFDLINQPLTEQARDLAVLRLPAHEMNDPVKREEARRSVPAVIEMYEQGTLIVPRGQPSNSAASSAVFPAK